MNDMFRAILAFRAYFVDGASGVKPANDNERFFLPTVTKFTCLPPPVISHQDSFPR